MLGRMKTIIVLVLVGASFTFLQAVRGQQKDGPPRLKADRPTFREMYDRLQPVDVYGKVIDEAGNPVTGVQVKIGWENASFLIGGRPDPGQKSWVTSDDLGLWKFHIEKPSRAFVNDARKPGYAPSIRNNPRVRDDLIRKPTTADNPVVSILRKKGETTFLLRRITWSCQVLVKESGKSKGYDFIRLEPVRDMTRLVLNDEPLVCDIQMTATFNANDGTWAVVLSPGNPTGGIIVTDQLLYEAPETGYQPEYAFTPKDRKPMKDRYVYLKSRDPAIYTRLAIDFVNAGKEFFRLSGTPVTNPYGDRNLEEEDDLPYAVTRQLTDEVQAAFRQNKRPVKPDLSPLIQTARDAEKARAEKEAAKLRRLQEGCSFDPARIRIRAAKGHIVESGETILPDNTTINEGDPLANVPIRIVIGVSQNMGFGESGPIWKPSKTWCYYTFTDAKGGFDIPAWAGECTEKPEPGTSLEVTGLEFYILAADRNAGVVAEGPDAVYPYRISHLTAPVAKSLATLLEMKAAPLHPEDEKRFQALCRELSIEAEKPPKGPP